MHCYCILLQQGTASTVSTLNKIQGARQVAEFDARERQKIFKIAIRDYVYNPYLCEVWSF